MAGFTVVIQDSVPMTRLGVATSTLTFLRQIGASVGLAAAGTIFSSSFASRLPTNLGEEGVPQALISQLVKVSGALQNVGNGRALLEQVLPGPSQALIPKVIAGANNALALSIGDLFWITIVSDQCFGPGRGRWHEQPRSHHAGVCLVRANCRGHLQAWWPRQCRRRSFNAWRCLRIQRQPRPLLPGPRLSRPRC